MALAETRDEDWRPKDTFGARLALIRQTMGWSYKAAGEACDVSDESWRHWEREMEPRSYQAACKKIAAATGCDLRWLMSGGPISPWTADNAGQGECEQMTSPFRHLVAI